MRINGRPAPFAADDTVVQVARRMQVDIPTLCYDPRLSPEGACRLCLVEVVDSGQSDSSPRLVPACNLKASETLEVQTATERLRRYRQGLLTLLLSELPDTPCAQCSNTENPCDLHRLAKEYGADVGQLEGEPSGAATKERNPFFQRNYEHCIYCYRCVRVCNDLEQAHAIAAAGRGYGSRITTLFDRELMATDCTFCGQCVSVCPTGALSDRLGDGKPSPVRSVSTVCGYCGTGCGMFVDVADGQIVGARPDPEAPASQGSLCVKGQFGWQYVHDQERLTTPLVRQDGELKPASWETALERVAAELSAVKASHGADSAVYWSSARATCEANYLFQKFARAVMGTNNVDNCARS